MIIEMNEAYRSLVVRDVEEEWAGPLVVTRGQVYDTRHCPGLIAVDEGELIGYLLYRPKKRRMGDPGAPRLGEKSRHRHCFD